MITTTRTRATYNETKAAPIAAEAPNARPSLFELIDAVASFGQWLSEQDAATGQKGAQAGQK